LAPPPVGAHRSPPAQTLFFWYLSRAVKTYHDIVGDGGSKILAQVVERRRRIADRLAGVRHTVAIGSGKGGVGKSTLTMQLAAALSRGGQRCAVLDADLNGPSQARLAGMRDVPFVPAEDGLALPRSRDGIGVVSLGAVIPESQTLEFDNVAPGESQTWRATREFTALADMLMTVQWGELDFLLVDLPPGAERTFQYAEFFGKQTPFVLVTVPSELARGVVARSIAALVEAGNPILGYVENMAGYYCADCDKIRPLFPPGDSVPLGIPALGSIPFDPELAALCDRGQPLGADPSRPSVTAVRETARSILRALESLA
jgi:ATP-binding protein involved in chromosome partitioning